MSARAVRRVVVAVCLLGVPALIATSIADVQGAAVTIGLVVATAVLCLIVATAVAPGQPAAGGAPAFDEARAEDVERRVQELVARGGDEAALRSLVREAVRLGMGASPHVGPPPAEKGG